MPRNRIPVASTTSVALTYTDATFAGARATFDSAKLMNTYRVPIEVTALRMLVEPRPSGVVTNLILSPFVRLELKLGRHYMTDGAVPISIMAPYRMWEQRKESFLTANDPTELSMRTIVLPRPIYLKPGMGLSGHAEIVADEMTTGAAAFGQDFTVNVHLAMIGRFLEDNGRVPEMHDVPMISHTQLTGTHPRSLEEELRNPLSKSLRVHRLTGTIASQSVGGATSWREAYSTLFASTVFHTVEIAFPNSDALSESEMEFAHIFGQMRTYPCSFDLPANTRLRAKSRLTDAGYGLQIGLFGTRPEVVS